jgi:hypothetical protein
VNHLTDQGKLSGNVKLVLLIGEATASTCTNCELDLQFNL